MSKYRVEDIRNVALAGHGASGKTSLADALLFKAKAVDRRGSVEDGTSVSDYDEEEHKRRFSIDASVLHLEHKGKQIRLIDTPGYPDSPASAPAGCPVNLEEARSQLVDAVVEADEALTEKYLMEGSVSAEELAAAIPKALAAGTVVPIFCTSAKKDKDVGVAELLDALAD